MSRYPPAILTAMALATLLLSLAGYFVWRFNTDRDPLAVPSWALIDKPVPEFDLPPLDGMGLPGLATTDLGKGEVVLVNVFASWCEPCEYEHPLLMELAESGALRVLGINYRDKPEDARRWLAELGNPYGRIGSDENGRAGIDWGLSGVPESYLIDPDGRVRYRRRGALNRRVVVEIVLPMTEAFSR